jgi:hypothetical protein
MLASRSPVTIPCPHSSAVGPSASGGNFTVEVSYQGPWYAYIQFFSALSKNPAYQKFDCMYTGTGTSYYSVQALNPGGGQTVAVNAYKLDSGSENLTATVYYGAASRTNSTALPSGQVSTYISVAP